MKRILIAGVATAMATVLASGGAMAGSYTDHDNYYHENNYEECGLVVSDQHLSSFVKNFGEGTIDEILDVAGPGVGFDLSVLAANEKIGISDDFAVDGAAIGCEPHSLFPSILSDCSKFKSYAMECMNLGQEAVNVAVYMNTGFTDLNTSSGCTLTNAQPEKCDTFYQSEWVEIPPGGSEKVKLNFDLAAQAYNCGDTREDQGCVDGQPSPVVRLHEVTNLGFQVANFDEAESANSWVICKGVKRLCRVGGYHGGHHGGHHGGYH
jgi:hypothetical protein